MIFYALLTGFRILCLIMRGKLFLFRQMNLEQNLSLSMLLLLLLLFYLWSSDHILVH